MSASQYQHNPTNTDDDNDDLNLSFTESYPPSDLGFGAISPAATNLHSQHHHNLSSSSSSSSAFRSTWPEDVPSITVDQTTQPPHLSLPPAINIPHTQSYPNWYDPMNTAAANNNNLGTSPSLLAFDALQISTGASPSVPLSLSASPSTSSLSLSPSLSPCPSPCHSFFSDALSPSTLLSPGTDYSSDVANKTSLPVNTVNRARSVSSPPQVLPLSESVVHRREVEKKSRDKTKAAFDHLRVVVQSHGYNLGTGGSSKSQVLESATDLLMQFRADNEGLLRENRFLKEKLKAAGLWKED